MKSWKKLVIKIQKSRRLLRQRGQALVEFILLLVAIASISFFFVNVMNRNIGRYWEYFANLVIDDRPGTQTVKLP